MITFNFLDFGYYGLMALAFLVLVLIALHWIGIVRVRTGTGFLFISTKRSTHHLSAYGKRRERKYGEHEDELGVGANT